MRKSKLKTKIEEQIATLQSKQHQLAADSVAVEESLAFIEAKLNLLTSLIEEDNNDAD